MSSYHKINSIFKRDMEGNKKLVEGIYSIPEFEYLKDNVWRFDEKLDGINVRINIYTNPNIQSIEFKGRTDKAQMPPILLERLQELFPSNKVFSIFEIGEEKPDVTLYGEGISHKIQSGGKYFKEGKGVDFVLFDIRIGRWWLKREDIETLAEKLGIRIAPIVGYGTLKEGVDLIKSKSLNSQLGNKDFLAEGIVVRPEIELRARSGQRIITKIKHKDF